MIRVVAPPNNSFDELMVQLPSGWRIAQDAPKLQAPYRTAHAERGRGWTLSISNGTSKELQRRTLGLAVSLMAITIAVWLTVGSQGMLFGGPLLVGLAYWCAANLINRTSISCRNGRLRVRRTPLPWSGNVTVDQQEVDAVVVHPKHHSSEEVLDLVAEANGMVFTTFAVKALLNSGRSVNLADNFTEEHQADFLQQLIESGLKQA